MITTFHDEPGIYFENTDQFQQVEATWKLVIEIDVRAIDARLLQLEDYCEHRIYVTTRKHTAGLSKHNANSRKGHRETKIINRTLKHLIPDT